MKIHVFTQPSPFKSDEFARLVLSLETVARARVALLFINLITILRPEMRRLFYMENYLPRSRRLRCAETFTYNKRQSWRINIARGPFSTEHYRPVEQNLAMDGYSRGIGLLEFTHIIALLRGISNFRRHMQDAVSLLCIPSLYIRTILHAVSSPSFVSSRYAASEIHALTSRFSSSHFARFKHP